MLPAVQLGSTAIPGKVNPVIPEFAMHCAAQVVGATAACGIATQLGELDLNVWEGLLVYNLSVSMALLTSGVSVYSRKCLAGLDVIGETSERHAMVRAAKTARRVQEASYSVALGELLEKPRLDGAGG